MEKTNDMMLNMLANPDFALRDFQAVGLKSENTQLLTEDQYKASSKITKNPYFLDADGNFDENKFHQAYVGAAYMYNKLATQDYNKSIIEDAKFSKDNMWVAPKNRVVDYSPRLVKTPNTYLVTNSLTSMGKKGERTQSISEIAQSQLIYDGATGEWKASPNDAFWENFTNTLVLATYDEDEYDDKGNLVHQKGDMKLNDDDLPYYETLNGRSVAGKQVLNKMNVLTTDGSTANKFDFFDSDDLDEKSFFGSAVKNAVLVGSMFLPYVGPTIAGLSVLSQTLGVIGTLGKLMAGSDNRTFNELEGWAKTVNRQAQTEYATKNTWCGENIINMIGDTIGQLAEQRWLFKALPTLVYGQDAYKAMSTAGREKMIADKTLQLNQERNGQAVKELLEEIAQGKFQSSNVKQDIAKYAEKLSFLNQEKAVKQIDDLISKANKIGSPLSKAYMTAITVQDAYGEAKEAGAEDWEAALLTMGYAVGEAAILNSEVGRWILPEARGDKFRAKAIAKALTKDVKEAYGELAETNSKPTLVKKLLNIGKKIADNDYAHYSGALSGAQTVLSHAGMESFEEVSEEVLADVSKSLLNGVRWLRGAEGLDMGQWDNIGDRYVMSALGGFLGGGITSAGTDFVVSKNLASMDKSQAMQELLYIVNNGKEKDFLKAIDGLELGNKSLSADKLIMEGPEGPMYAQGTELDNQDKQVKQLVHNLVDLLKSILESEGAKLSTNSLINKLVLEDGGSSLLKDLRFSGLRGASSLGLYLQDFQNILADIVATKSAILALDSKLTDGSHPTQDDIDLRQQLTNKLHGLRVKKDAYVKGQIAGDFVRDAVFELNPILSDFAVKANLDRYAKYKYGRDFDKLTNTEKEEVSAEFENYKNTDLKNDVHQLAAHFLDMMENVSPVVTNFLETIKAMKDSHNVVQQVQTQLANTLQVLANVDTESDADSTLAIMQSMLMETELNAETAMSKYLLLPNLIQTLSNIINRPLVGATEEELFKDNQQRTFEYQQALNDMMLESFDGIVDPFIKQGYLHPETKKLVDGIATILKKKAILKMGETTGPESNYWANVTRNILDKQREIKNLSNTPILTWLAQYQSVATDSQVNVQQHWDNTIAKFANVDKTTAFGHNYSLDEFGIDDEWERNNKEVALLLDSFKAVITGMRNDNADFNNPTGYSKMLNNVYRQAKVLNYVPLAEIDAQDADLILEDINMLQNRFGFAENLNAVNKGQKLREQSRIGVNQNLLLYKNFKYLVGVTLPSWKNKEILDNALRNLSFITEDLLANKNLRLSEDERYAQEKDLLNILNAVHEFFEANKGADGHIDKSLLKELISGVMDDAGYFEKTGDLMTEKTENMDKNSFIWWLAARGALKASEFNKAYKASLNEKIAPIPSQELAVYLGVASVANMDFLNDFVDAYREAADEMFKGKTVDERKALLKGSGISNSYADELLDYFIGNDALPQYRNIIFIEGAPGTGKSGGVFTSVKAVLDNLDPEYLKDAFYVHATQSSADKAAEKIGMSGKTFGKEQFMKYLSNEWKDARNNKQTFKYNGVEGTRPTLYEDSYEIVDGRLQNKWKLNKYTDAPKVIFLDELSHYNELELSMIEQWAREHQTVVIGAGDLDQDTNVTWCKVKDDWFDVSNTRNKFIRTLKLGASLRTLNSQITKSNAAILNALTTRRNDEDASISITMSYHLDEKDEHPGLYGVMAKNVAGDYTDLDIEQIDKTIQLMINTKSDPDSKIGYIYHDTNSKLYKHIMSKYSGHIDPFYGSDAQGLEGQYYIVENNRDDKTTDTDTYLRSLYTGISRAEQGVLAIVPNYLGKINSISSIEDKEYQLESIGEQAIKRESEKKNALLDRLIEDTNPANIELKRPERHEVVAAATSTSGPATTPPAAPSGTGTPPPTGGFPPMPPAPTPPAITRVNFGFNDRATAENELTTFLATLASLGNLDEIEVTRNSDGAKFTIASPGITETEVGGETIFTPSFILTSEDGSAVFNASVMELSADYTLSSSAGVAPAYSVGLKLVINEGTGQSNVVISKVIPGTPIKYEVTDLDGTNPRPFDQITLQNAFVSEFVEPVEPEPEPIETGLENDGAELRRAAEGAGVQPEVVEHKAPVKSGEFIHELYSAMSFEMGVDKDTSGKIKFNGPKEKFDARIDNGIGLSKLMGTDNYDVIEDELAYLKNDINNVENNAELAANFKARLGLTGDVKIDYALKTTAGRVDTGEHPEYDRYDQGDSEQFKHPQMDDKTSHKQKLVAIISNDGENVLELSVATLDSPETLLLMESNGEKIFTPMYNLWQAELTRNGGDNYKALDKVYETFKDDPALADIANRIRMWQYTSNGIIYLPKDFNVATQLHPTAPFLSSFKGKWDEYHKYFPEFKDIEEVKHLNKQLRFSSIMASDKGLVDGKKVKGLNPGHAFVLVSADNKLQSDADMVNYYRQQVAGTVPPKISLMYVLPPKETPSAWVKNVYNIFTGNGGTKFLGNQFTGYRIVEALVKANKMKDLQSFLGDDDTINDLTKAVQELNEIENKWKADNIAFKDADEQQEFDDMVREYGEEATRKYMMNHELKNKLRSELESTSVGIPKNTTYLQAFQNFLVGAIDPKAPTTKTEAQRLALIDSVTLAAEFEEVFYLTPYSSENVEGTFIKILTDPTNPFNMIGTIDGNPKPFQVSIKVDAPQYNTDILNPVIAAFVQHTKPPHDAIKTWTMDTWLRRRHEDRYLGKRKVTSGPTIGEKIESTYKAYFDSNELNKTILNLDIAEDVMLQQLITDYNSKPGNYGIIHNGKMVLAKFDDPKFKLVNPSLTALTDNIQVYDTAESKVVDVEIIHELETDGNIKSLSFRCSHYTKVSNPVSSPTFTLTEDIFAQLAETYKKLYDAAKSGRRLPREVSDAYGAYGKILRGEMTSMCDPDKSSFENLQNILQLDMASNMTKVQQQFTNMANFDMAGIDATIRDAVRADGQMLLNMLNGVGTFDLNVYDEVLYNGNIYEISQIAPDNSTAELLTDAGVIPDVDVNELLKIKRDCAKQKINLI